MLPLTISSTATWHFSASVQAQHSTALLIGQLPIGKGNEMRSLLTNPCANEQQGLIQGTLPHPSEHSRDMSQTPKLFSTCLLFSLVSLPLSNVPLLSYQLHNRREENNWFSLAFIEYTHICCSPSAKPGWSDSLQRVTCWLLIRHHWLIPSEQDWESNCSSK